jgi:adenylate cyclase
VATVEIQRAVAAREAERFEPGRIRYRLGIKLGDVVVDGSDIYGDGINVAARIEGLCEPGGIWLSRSVHTAVAGKLDVAFEPTGRHRVKNITEPIETWRVRPDAGGDARTLRPAATRRVWAGIVAAALVALALTGGAGWYFWLRPATEMGSLALAGKPSRLLSGFGVVGPRVTIGAMNG